MVAERAWCEFIPIQLHPEVFQSVRRLVVIDNLGGAGELVLLLVELDLDVVVGPLLPVFGAGCSRGDSVFGRSGPNFLQLAKWIVVKLDGMSQRIEEGAEKYECDLHGEFRILIEGR